MKNNVQLLKENRMAKRNEKKPFLVVFSFFFDKKQITIGTKERTNQKKIGNRKRKAQKKFLIYLIITTHVSHRDNKNK